jgi:hypothetical protein
MWKCRFVHKWLECSKDGFDVLIFLLFKLVKRDKHELYLGSISMHLLFSYECLSVAKLVMAWTVLAYLLFADLFIHSLIYLKSFIGILNCEYDFSRLNTCRSKNTKW